MTKKGEVLLVDDEEYVRDSLSAILSRRGFEVQMAASVQEALERNRQQGVDVVLTDLRMPQDDGLSLIKTLKEKEPWLPVVVLTAHGNVASAVECFKAGAYDFLQKPVDPEEVVMSLERAIEDSMIRREWRYLRSRQIEDQDKSRPLGESPAWRKALELAEAVAPTDSSILIQGESGTGKELMAHYLHRCSERKDGPFVRVNCAAIPIELFESEFFGHRKGAFTGAIREHEGRFLVADQGTLFLDEIASMPAAVQAKVLRVIQEGEFERIGDAHPRKVDVRLIAATNADLEEEVESGSFRRDLFYRINVVTLDLPPLRARREDIPLLAGFFLKKLSARIGKCIDGIERSTLKALQGYSWPGNVRELANVLERAVILESSNELSPSSLPPNLRENKNQEAGDLNLRRTLAREEKRILKEALERSNGVRRQAAKRLGIDERNLAYYLKKHGIL